MPIRAVQMFQITCPHCMNENGVIPAVDRDDLLERLEANGFRLDGQNIICVICGKPIQVPSLGKPIHIVPKSMLKKAEKAFEFVRWWIEAHAGIIPESELQKVRDILKGEDDANSG